MGAAKTGNKFNWTAQPAEVYFDFLVGLAYLVPAIKFLTKIAI